MTVSSVRPLFKRPNADVILFRLRALKFYIENNIKFKPYIFKVLVKDNSTIHIIFHKKINIFMVDNIIESIQRRNDSLLKIKHSFYG